MKKIVRFYVALFAAAMMLSGCVTKTVEQEKTSATTDLATNVQAAPSVKVQEYTDSIVIKESPKKKMPQGLGLALGKIVTPEGKDKAEKNMISQFSTYCSALLYGDKDNCVKYFYKDAAEYFRKNYFHGYTDEQVMDAFFNSTIETFRPDKLQDLNNQGIEFKIDVASLIRRVEYNENIFITFKIGTNVCSESLYTHFDSFEESIAISENGGKNWTFLTLNEDTPNILRISYPEEVIDAIMGY